MGRGKSSSSQDAGWDGIFDRSQESCSSMFQGPNVSLLIEFHICIACAAAWWLSSHLPRQYAQDSRCYLGESWWISSWIKGIFKGFPHYPLPEIRKKKLHHHPWTPFHPSDSPALTVLSSRAPPFGRPAVLSIAKVASLTSQITTWKTHQQRAV